MVWDASGSSPPLAVLPFGLGFGAWQSLGPGRRGLVAVGGVLAVTRVTLYRVFGGGGCLQPPGSGRRSNHAARLVPERGPRAAAVRDAGAVLAPAGIPGFSSQPLSPLSAAPAARGGFVPPSPWECSLLGGGFGFQLGVGGISIFRISQLFPFPSSFAHPERLRLGCSLLSRGTLTRFSAGLSCHQGLLPPARGLSPSRSPLPGRLRLPTQAPLLWKRCFGAAGSTNANTARATAGELEASQECFQVQVFLRCPGLAQNRDQQCLHEHWDAADRILGFSFLLFSPNIKLSC